MDKEPDSKRRRGYDHRLWACVQRGKCVEGVELPVADPASRVTEGRIDASRKPRKKSAEPRSEARRGQKLTDEQLVEFYFEKRKSMRDNDAGNELVKAPGEPETSIDVALAMLRNKARMRERNRFGAELLDVKDRMTNVIDDYDDLLWASPYCGPADMEVTKILQSGGIEQWRDSVNALICGHANRCQEREEVLEDLFQSLPFDDDEEEKAPSIASGDIEEVERAGAEISESLENVQVKARKLNFLHYNILKSRSTSNPRDLRAYHELDLQKKVVDRFKQAVKDSNKRKAQVDAWKFAADEIVGLLKSSRGEGALSKGPGSEFLLTFLVQSQMQEVEESFNKLLSAFNAQGEELEAANSERSKQREIVRFAKKETKKVQSDNILLQDQIESFKQQLKASTLTSKRLQNKLAAHLEAIDAQELHEAIATDDEHGKEIIYIKQMRKVKEQADELEKKNTSLLEENKNLLASLAEAMNASQESENCSNCSNMQQNFQETSAELASEQEKVESLERSLAESQAQVLKANQELMLLKQQNNKPTQKAEALDESAISLQSSQSLLSAHPSFCPPEISNDQLSSADESGYTSHEISTVELKSFKTRLSRVEERRISVTNCTTQTLQQLPIDSSDKAIQVQVEIEDAERVTKTTHVDKEQEENMKQLNRMIRHKDYDEKFTDVVDKQVELICQKIGCFNQLAELIETTNTGGEDVESKANTTSSDRTNSETFTGESHESPGESHESPGESHKSRPENLTLTKPPLDMLDERGVVLQSAGSHSAGLDKGKVVESGSERTVLENATLISENMDSAGSTVLNTTELDMPDVRPTENKSSKELDTSLDHLSQPIEGSVKNDSADPDAINSSCSDSMQTAGPDFAQTDAVPCNSMHVNLRASLEAIRTELKKLHGKKDVELQDLFNDWQKHTTTEEFTVSHWKPNMNIHKDGEAVLIAHTLNQFAEESWMQFNSNFKKIIHRSDLSEEYKTKQHIKLISDYAMKILEVIGVSISEMSQFYKRERSKRKTSLPPIKAKEMESKQSAKLLTEMTGIWLPKIAITATDDSKVIDNEEPVEPAKPSVVESSRPVEMKSKEKKHAKQPTLPLIKNKKSESPKKHKKPLMGIGRKQTMAAKSGRTEEDATDNPSSRGTVEPTDQHSQRNRKMDKRRAIAAPNFRAARLLGKNRRLVTLLSKSGKTMQEINTIIGLKQGLEEEPVSIQNGIRHVNNDKLGLSSLGLSSKPIALPKISEKHHHTIATSCNQNNIKSDQQQHNNNLCKLNEVLSATSILPVELHTAKKSGILALGNSLGSNESEDCLRFPVTYGRHPSIVPGFPHAKNGTTNSHATGDLSINMMHDHGSSSAREKRRASHRYQRRSSLAPEYSPNGEGMLQSFNVNGKNRNVSTDDDNCELGWMKRPLGGNRKTKETLFEQRRHRRVSHGYNHKKKPKLQLPQLAIKRGF
eukprot:gene10848-12001_t